jgi:hypothetical protein
MTQMTPKGGKREGAGRKPSPNPATKLATIKMTPRQHARFIELGGSRWVKSLIDKDQSEWTEFEPWAEYVSMDIEKDEQGYYTSITTDMALQAWEMAKK